jgi:Mu-like prophage tail sheath protein gpL
MAIRHTFPSDKRRPGVSHEFDFLSGSRGLVPTQRRIALIGIRTTGSGSATNGTPVQVFTEAHADELFGTAGGSELALMCRAALRTFVDMGVAAELWAVPMAAPAGVAATGTLVVSGSTTESGDIVFSIAGRVFRAAVASGATATVCGDAIVNAVKEALNEVPGTVANAAGTVTYTHNHLGVNGNDVKLRVRSRPAGITVTPTQPASGSGAADITTSLDALLTIDFEGIAIANHTSADTADILANAADAWAATKKRWRHYFVGENGTLATATTLAGTANDQRVVVVSFELSEALPGVLAASVCAMASSREAPNFNFNSTNLSAIPPIENPQDEFIDTEVETAIAGGVTPITLDDSTGRSMLERLVTTKKTQGSNPFFDLLDLAHSKTVAYTARQVDAAVARVMHQRNLDDELVRQVRSTTYNVLKREEDLGYLHRVDQHAAELKTERDPNVIGRLLLEIPESVVPLAHQTHAVHRMFVGE